MQLHMYIITVKKKQNTSQKAWYISHILCIVHMYYYYIMYYNIYHKQYYKE